MDGDAGASLLPMRTFTVNSEHGTEVSLFYTNMALNHCIFKQCIRTDCFNRHEKVLFYSTLEAGQEFDQDSVQRLRSKSVALLKHSG